MADEIPEARIINFRRQNIAICEALGLDPQNVSRVTIILEPNNNSVTIETFVHNEEADKLATVIKQYQLTEMLPQP